MSLVLNEDQRLLKESALAFCRDNVPVSIVRRLRDTRDPKGYDESVWRQAVDLGWAGMTFPEAYGGFEFGHTGLGIVLEASGHSLMNSPLISTVLMCGTAINLGGSAHQKEKLLPGIISGDLVLAPALDEKAHHDPVSVSTSAQESDGGFRINGRKVHVLDAHIADQLLVSVRTAGKNSDADGISLLLVDRDAPGISINRTFMVDGRNAATVVFDNVKVNSDSLLGKRNEGFSLLERMLDTARIGLAAEMLGSVEEIFERTIEYLKQRKQFGVPIGAFQALQHRAAEMYCEIELCRSVVLAALDALDNDQDSVKKLASLAKAKLSEVFLRVSNEGIQMHGGIGMTDEFDIGFFLKRARVAQQFLGDQIYHRNRYAELCGF